MRPTLQVGDYIAANPALFGATLPFTRTRLPGIRVPAAGDVVVYRPSYNDPLVDVVKRIVGVPGDTVGMQAGTLVRNGRPVEELHAIRAGHPDRPMSLDGPLGQGWHIEALPDGIFKARYSPTRDSWGPLVVPAGHYFVLGDNREESIDSRYMGFVPRDEIRAKVWFIYFSSGAQIQDGASVFLQNIRRERILKLVR
jgi:signal peptidase I